MLPVYCYFENYVSSKLSHFENSCQYHCLKMCTVVHNFRHGFLQRFQHIPQSRGVLETEFVGGEKHLPLNLGFDCVEAFERRIQILYQCADRVALIFFLL